MTKRLFTIVLLLCSISLADYNPAASPNCIGWWRMETGALTTDSSKNSNTMSNSGVTADDTVGDVAEGTSSGYFDGSSMMSILCSTMISDSDPNPDTPWPMGTSPGNQNYTVAAWVKFDSLLSGQSWDPVMSQITETLSLTSSGNTTYDWRRWMISSNSAGGTKGYFNSQNWMPIRSDHPTASGDTFVVNLVYSNNRTLSTGVWYHFVVRADFDIDAGDDGDEGDTGGIISFSVNGTTTSHYSYIYKASSEGGVAYYVTPWTGGTYYLGAASNLNQKSGVTSSPLPDPVVGTFLTGHLDDVIWFDRWMSDAEIAEIEAQTYNPALAETGFSGQVIMFEQD